LKEYLPYWQHKAVMWQIRLQGGRGNARKKYFVYEKSCLQNSMVFRMLNDNHLRDERDVVFPSHLSLALDRLTVDSGFKNWHNDCFKQLKNR
jgi:hypothetical protein